MENAEIFAYFIAAERLHVVSCDAAAAGSNQRRARSIHNRVRYAVFMHCLWFCPMKIDHMQRQRGYMSVKNIGWKRWWADTLELPYFPGIFRVRTFEQNLSQPSARYRIDGATQKSEHFGRLHRTI